MVKKPASLRSLRLHLFLLSLRVFLTSFRSSFLERSASGLSSATILERTFESNIAEARLDECRRLVTKPSLKPAVAGFDPVMACGRGACHWSIVCWFTWL